MHFNGLNVSGALEVFLSLHDFWVQKGKKNFLKKISVFIGVFFYRIDVLEVTNPFSIVEKTPNTLISAYDRFFMIFFY